MSQPLDDDEIADVLKPNPISWGEDGYPALEGNGQPMKLFGLPVICRPDMDRADLRIQNGEWMLPKDD